jgi:hypothetical protein
MVLGVALLALGGFCTAVMVGILLGASNDGTFVIAGAVTLGHQGGAALAVAFAVIATGLLFLGLRRLEMARWSQALSDRSDDRVPAIEQLARVRLLKFRYDQLKREVEGLELRRGIATEELDAPLGITPDEALGITPDEAGDELLLLPDAEGSTLSRRMRSGTG